jgi:hypothetical protein
MAVDWEKRCGCGMTILYPFRAAQASVFYFGMRQYLLDGGSKPR